MAKRSKTPRILHDRLRALESDHYVINMVETYLPQQEIFDAREEIMQVLQEVEQTWMGKLLEKGNKKVDKKGCVPCSCSC